MKRMVERTRRLRRLAAINISLMMIIVGFLVCSGEADTFQGQFVACIVGLSAMAAGGWILTSVLRGD